MALHARFHASIDDIPAAEWDELDLRGNPFPSHAFLAAAERHGAAAPKYGWQPSHVALRDAGGSLVGALPLYLRTHSFGDFSQDWNWPAAWGRAGLPYYPKLVTGIPFTPAGGPRLLAAHGARREAVAAALIEAALERARDMGCSAWQCLFVEEGDLAPLVASGLLLRRGCQFHWSNRAYASFDDFLATFSAEKRKKVRRERRRVQEAGLSIETRHGDEIDRELWRVIHRLYRATFDKYGNLAAFPIGFFAELASRLPRNVVVFLARRSDEVVAAAICYRSASTLYGRHWGVNGDYPSLHFELCYYQGIEYCIRHGLARFEPGAHGEHKVSRGFSPVATWSAHWIADPRMRKAIEDYLQRERPHVEAYEEELAGHAPYAKHGAAALSSPRTRGPSGSE